MLRYITCSILFPSIILFHTVYAQPADEIGILGGVNDTHMFDVAAPGNDYCLGCTFGTAALLNKKSGLGADLLFFDKVKLGGVVALSLDVGLSYKHTSFDYYYDYTGNVHSLNTTDTIGVVDYTYKSGNINYQSIYATISPAIDFYVFSTRHVYLHLGGCIDGILMKELSTDVQYGKFEILPYLPDSSGIQPIEDSIINSTDKMKSPGGFDLVGGLGYKANATSKLPLRIELCFYEGLYNFGAYDLYFKRNGISLRVGFAF